MADYATRAEAKAILGIASSDTTEDTLVDSLITAASSAIDQYCDRPAGFSPQGTQTRYYTALEYYRIDVDDLLTVSSLATDDGIDGTYSEVWTAGTYNLTPYNAALEGRPYTGIESSDTSILNFPKHVTKGVKIIGTWGWSAIPAAIKQACLLEVAKLYASRNAPFGVIGTGDAGGVTRMSTRMHPAAVALLDPYRNRKGAAS
jgi:hypothetical protein